MAKGAMTKVAVIGGGVGGLTCGMLLARDGHEVTVLERDAAPPPQTAGEAWASWERRGVNQFRMIHMFLPRFRQLLERELPDAFAAVAARGATAFNPLRVVPDALSGGFRDSDAQFDALTARRPVMESALAEVAARTPGLTVRRGAAVAGLLTAPGSGVPHVCGVRLESGEELRADVVVDAAGRRSSLPAMLAAVGAAAPADEVEDSGFVYYGRHFRSVDGTHPPFLCGALSAWGTVSTLTLPADNGTWGLGIITSAQDAALRRLKDVDVWMRTWKSFPLVAHWVDGEPLDDEVAVMAKIADRHRTLVVDGAPVATGVLAVADSWACTNPSLGRGASIGFLHAVALRDLLRDLPGAGAGLAPADLARRWHEVTVETVEPYYRATLDFDRHRLAEIEAGIDGVTYAGDPGWELTRALESASGKDGDVFREAMRIAAVLATPDDVFAAPGMRERVLALGGGWRDEEVPAPTRAELLAIVAG